LGGCHCDDCCRTSIQAEEVKFKSFMLALGLVWAICWIVFITHLLWLAMMWLKFFHVEAMFGVLAVMITIFTFLIHGSDLFEEE
jgi:hypothetical protein